jgi:hypothetical protein
VSMVSVRPARTQVRSPHHGRCALTLRVNKTTYRVRLIPSDRLCVIRRFELHKPSDGARYFVTQHDERNVVCTCPTFDAERDPMGCHHVAAMVAVGLVATRPVRLHPPSPSDRYRREPRALVQGADTDDLVRGVWSGHPADETGA